MSYHLGFKGNLPQMLSRQALDDVWIPLDLKSLQTLQQAGAKTHVPSLFYDNETYDHLSLEIYHSLLEALSECSVLLEETDSSKYLNLVAVFFQEILRILCAYAFKRYELDYLTANYDLSFSGLCTSPPSSFPYVDYDFVAKPDSVIPQAKLDSKTKPLDARQLAKQLLALPQKINISRNRRFQLAVTTNVNSDMREIRNCLNGLGAETWDVRVLRAGQAKISIPHFVEQFNVLEASLRNLGKKLRMVLPNSLVCIIEQRIKPFLGQQDEKHNTLDVLLAGSLVHPEARVTAAHMKSIGVPVVSVFHGEACGAHDEPVFGYGENTFTDAVIGYGDIGCSLVANGEYSASLLGDPVRYVPSTSAKAHTLFEQSEPQCLSDINSPKFMYVPTSFIDSGRYGPYRDMHDVAYFEWQRGLMTLMGELFPERTIWKPHIKETTDAQFPQISGVNIVTDKRLEELVDDVDVFVFDYVSTAFTLAAATAKPIIFLDIGLRNLHPQAMDYVINRSIYIRADPEKPQEALHKAFDQSGKGCSNEYTPALSLSNDLRSRSEVIAEVLSGLVKQNAKTLMAKSR